MRFPHIAETSVNCQKPVQCEWNLLLAGEAETLRGKL
jgi:hypothetical protein